MIINHHIFIYNLLTKQKKAASPSYLVGEDLDVLIKLLDKILVIYGGKDTGTVDGRTAKKEEIGHLMTRHASQDQSKEEISDAEK